MGKVICAVLSAAIALGTGASARAAEVKVGEPAPKFMLRDGTGALVALERLAYPGKARARRPKRAVVLDFFSTDCAPCKRGLPHLIKLHHKLQGAPVEVILIAVLEEEAGAEKLEAFLKKNPVPFQVLVDPYSAAAKKYVVTDGKAELPALFVIDPSGVTRAALKGLKAQDVERVAHQIKDMLP